MTETEMQDTLINILLDSGSFRPHAIDSFEDAGIMTRNRGIVLSVKGDDGVRAVPDHRGKKPMKLHEMPNEQRPRTRLFERGPGALRDAELLAVLLPTGPKGTCALQVAEDLMARFRDLPSIARAPVEELAKVPGIGEVKAAQIHAAIEIGVRLARRRASANKFDDASRIAELVGQEMRLLPAESARVVLLNAKLHLIAVEEVSRGLLDQALVAAREVFSPAILKRAYALVLVHNHPSGDCGPSEADIRITRSLKEASKVLDIPLLDHVIIGSPSTAYPEGWFSFKAAGYI